MDPAEDKDWDLPGYDKAQFEPCGFTVEGGPSNVGRVNRSDPARPSHVQTPNLRSRGASFGIRARGGFLRGRGRAHGRGRGRGRGNATYRNPSQLFRDSPAKAKWRAGEAPSGLVDLPARFGILKHPFFEIAKAALAKESVTPQARYDVFEELHVKTGAFIKTPSYEDQIIYLWGESESVASAEGILQRLVEEYRRSSHNQRPEWAKIHAYSVEKEADAVLEEQGEHKFQLLKKEPASSTAFHQMLLFNWPPGKPTMSEALGPELEALDKLRAKFGCTIYAPKELPHYICVLGNRQDAMRKLLRRLRGIWCEAMAGYGPRQKVYIVEPPTVSSMKEGVMVKRGKYASKPFLHGAPLPDAEFPKWFARAQLIRAKNNGRILDAVEKALQGILFDRRQLRMRVNFGAFVLTQYRRSRNGPLYSYEEYREMLLHDEVKGRLVAGLRLRPGVLLDRCFMETELLEPIGTTSTLPGNCEHAFSASFEFFGGKNALLCMEAEISRRPGAFQYEVSHCRWFRSCKTNDVRSPLQVGVTDFDRCDWQLEIKSLEPLKKSSIDTALIDFSHAITFKCGNEAAVLTGKPERKVTFPASAPVSRFVEKTAIRFRVKSTNYILEIARHDQYERVPDENLPGLPGDFSKVPSTSWAASLFDPNWDNLLGQHANLPVGAPTQYSPELNTFFAPRDQSETSDQSANFWQFIDMMKKVARILGAKNYTVTSSARRNGGKFASKIDTSSKETAKGKAPSQDDSPSKENQAIDIDHGTLF